MSLRRFSRVVVTCIIFTLPLSAGAAPQESKSHRFDQASINRLVNQLGSERFTEREAASKELAALGEPALDALYKARTGPDAEVRQRAEWLISHIETGMDRKELDVTAKLILREHSMSVTCLTFLPDSKTLASGSDDGDVCLWDTATAKQRVVLQGHDGFVEAVALSPDGATLASAGSFGGIHLWDVTTRKRLGMVRVNNVFPRALAFAADHKLFVTFDDGTVRMLDPAMRKQAITISQSVAGPLALTPDGRMLAFAAEAGGLKLWDVAAGRERCTLDGKPGAAYALAFAPDGAVLALAEGRWKHDGGWMVPRRPMDPCQAHLLDVRVRKERALLKGHKGNIYCLAFSQDGKTLASAGADATVRLWDGTTGRALGILKAHTREVFAVCFSPDGRTLATGSRDKTVKVWDVAKLLAKKASE